MRTGNTRNREPKNNKNYCSILQVNEVQLNEKRFFFYRTKQKHTLKSFNEHESLVYYMKIGKELPTFNK